jgi:flagellar motor switch protein FliN/FliY
MSTDTLASTIEPAAKPNGASAPRLNRTLIDNVDITIDTYLGSTTMTIATLNELRAGSVIALDAALNEVVELRLNGVCIAHGELVAVGDKFGVRITALSS